MHSDIVIYSIFLIFAGCAFAATFALFARQALPVAYILLGVAVGPWGFGWLRDISLIQNIAEIGIIFLLFLLGLNLHPQKLVSLFRQTTVVTLGSSFVFVVLGGLVAWVFGFNTSDCIVIALACVFSSTIIGLKLLPATVLHHRHRGELMISVLLLQDLIAIVALLVVAGMSRGDMSAVETLLLLAALPALITLAWVIERYLVRWLFIKFDRITEYVFLLAIGWCLGMAQLGNYLGLSYEIGAFIAGVAIANSPISRFIAESLRPLRDFFLVIFFFALGAGFHWQAVAEIILPAIMLALMFLFLKPLVFSWLFMRQSEEKDVAVETGVRLGQMSEFSLLLAIVALQSGVLTRNGAYLIQLATMLTFLFSTYYIVSRYPTPIATNDKLRRD